MTRGAPVAPAISASAGGSHAVSSAKLLPTVSTPMAARRPSVVLISSALGGTQAFSRDCQCLGRVSAPVSWPRMPAPAGPLEHRSDGRSSCSVMESH